MNTQKEFLKDFEIIKLRWIPRFVGSKGSIIASWCINFQCLEIYGFDPAHFLSATGLTWQVALKKTKVKLKLLTDIDILLMVENGINSGICHAIQWWARLNNKCMKKYDKNKESPYPK